VAQKSNSFFQADHAATTTAPPALAERLDGRGKHNTEVAGNRNEKYQLEKLETMLGAVLGFSTWVIWVGRLA
jgi:hypothetical protein